MSYSLCFILSDDWANRGSVDISWGSQAGEYGFSTLGVDAILIYLLFYYFLSIYLFSVKSLFTTKYKYYTVFKK